MHYHASKKYTQELKIKPPHTKPATRVLMMSVYLREVSCIHTQAMFPGYSCVWIGKTSLVPRPHPLTRRIGLVYQVEFLGLAHDFATKQWSKHFAANPLKKSLPLTGNKPKKFNFVHQTISRLEVCVGGAQDYRKAWSLEVIAIQI